jgi:signal transduction histidine kinase
MPTFTILPFYVGNIAVAPDGVFTGDRAQCGPSSPGQCTPVMNNFEEDIAAVGSIKAIPTILNVVCRTTGMRFAAVARVTEDRWIACSVHDDIAFGLQPGGELKVESTICHEIRQSGKAVIIDHVSQDAIYRDHHTPAIYGLQSYISMPIRLADGSFFGTLCAIDPEPHQLNTPEIISMFEMFAEVIGYHLSAIDRLHSTETNLLNERQTSALREQFIAVLGHDLRNPVAAIHGGMHLLLNTPLSDNAKTIVAMVQRSVTRMNGLIDNVMDLARGRLGDGLVLDRNAAEPLEPVLRQVVAELQITAPERRIETIFELSAPIDCDRSRMGQLASNLLGNALTYGTPSEPIRIGAKTNGGRFELFVANAGDPIPRDVLESIFLPFSRGTLGASRQGLGLGLYISHEIAKAHGGQLEVVSTPAETRFTFRMPLIVPKGQARRRPAE